MLTRIWKCKTFAGVSNFTKSAFSLKSSAQTAPHAASHLLKGSLVAYETSTIIDVNVDNSLLEKSLRQGCKTVLVHSRATEGEHHQTYELLSDLWATEDVDLNQFTIAHCLSPAGKGSNSGKRSSELLEIWQKDLTQINEILRHRSLDYVCITVSEHDVWDHLKEQVEDVRRLVATVGGAPLKGGVPVKVGLHIPTTFLANISDTRAQALKSFLLQSNSTGLVDMFSIATNCATSAEAARVRAWIGEGCLTGGRAMPLVIASETLRVHSRRPGLLAAPTNFSTQRKSLNIPDNATTVVKTEDNGKASALDATMAAAMEEFKQSMNRCLHVENKYFENLAKLVPQVPLTDVCWAHNLMQTQSTFRAPEEWEYAMRMNVLPKLDAAFATLKKTDRQCADFTVVYHGLVRNLFSVFLYVHQIRRLKQCSEALAAVRAKTPDIGSSFLANTGANDDRADTLLAALECCNIVGCVVSTLAARVVQADVVAVSNTEVASHRWDRAVQLVNSLKPIQAQLLLQEALHPVLEKYN